MSRKSDCWDNAVAESFFGSIKTEAIHHYKFKTREEAKHVIFEYIEVFYNRIRIHSANDCIFLSIVNTKFYLIVNTDFCPTVNTNFDHIVNTDFDASVNT